MTMSLHAAARSTTRLCLHLSGPALVLLTSTLSILLTLALLAVFAWRDRVQSFTEARLLTTNLTHLLAEHAVRLFETSDFILTQAIELAGPPDAPIPDSREAWTQLVRLSHATPYVASIWLGDADGRVVLITRNFPAPSLRANDRNDFQALKNGQDGVIIGRFNDNRHTGERLIVLSRRLPSPPGTFRGFATITIDPHYLRSFYRSITIGYDPVIVLAKSDLSVLLREPPLPDEDLDRLRRLSGFLPQRFAAGPAGSFTGVSPIDGVERLVAYQRIGDRDAFVIVSIPTAEVEARWLAQLSDYSYYGMAALTAILLLTWLALQRARRETVAQHALRDANTLLERRVDERTAELQRALADKDLLFHEVHHRIKNNLQVVSSLLQLQAPRLDDRARQAIEESLNRIQAMSLVHELLYRSRQPANLDFGAYLRTLCDTLARIYAASAGRVRVEVQATKFPVDLDTATPLALAVNELVSNAFKHAFPDGRQGTIRVVLECRDQQWRLSVSDDGTGLPEAPVGTRGSGLGLTLVKALARQVGATLSIDRSAGTTALLVLPAAKEAGNDARQ